MAAPGNATSRDPNVSRDKGRQFIARHALSILIGWTILLLCLLALTGEVLLRWATVYRIDYYTGEQVSNRLIKFPFGDMPFNSNGYPDREWDNLDPRPRVGFWGDSITSGVGAGFGYRFSDIISAARKDKYYMNFGGVGEDGVADDNSIDKIIALTARFRLRKIIYAMDLNDILPNRDAREAAHSALYTAKPAIKKYVDVLRTRSYLYNFLRFKATIVAARLGYGYHGDEAFELHPTRNAVVVQQTVDRINELWTQLQRRDVELCVVVFPYEMQISADAAEKYRRLGVQWSSEFLAGEPQGMILSRLAPGIVAVDLSPAFRVNTAQARPIGVGKYFVYDRGDALDWEHPNRAGSRLIGDYLVTRAASCL
jgi:hypothetical protein